MGFALVIVVLLGSADSAPAPQAQPKGKKLPPPVELGGNDLLTSDGVQLAATFYPGTQGQDTVPIVLLHMADGSRKDYLELAPVLQEQGHAVLVPDLRGHGDSTRTRFGGTVRLDSRRAASVMYYDMVYKDMEALRRFLIDKNDAAELNLNRLCIVGAEMGAAVALYYAQNDWTMPRREADRLGPPQDVKALALISPDWAFPGLPLSKPLGDPIVRSQIAMMILVGKEESKPLSDARRIHKLLQRHHPAERQDLFIFELPTKLQGTKMVGVKSLAIEVAIHRFIEGHMAQNRYSWEQRGKGK